MEAYVYTKSHELLISSMKLQGLKRLKIFRIQITD